MTAKESAKRVKKEQVRRATNQDSEAKKHLSAVRDIHSGVPMKA
jgi:hypothetical protein